MLAAWIVSCTPPKCCTTAMASKTTAAITSPMGDNSAPMAVITSPKPVTSGPRIISSGPMATTSPITPKMIICVCGSSCMNISTSPLSQATNCST